MSSPVLSAGVASPTSPKPPRSSPPRRKKASSYVHNAAELKDVLADDRVTPSTVAAIDILKRLEDENELLKQKNEDLVTELQSVSAECSNLKNKCMVQNQQAESVSSKIAELENQVYILSSELEDCRKENRIFAKEKADLSEKVEKEIKCLDVLRTEWASKEESLLNQLKAKNAEIRLLKSSASAVKDCTVVDDSTNNDIDDLKMQVKTAERTITELRAEVEKLESQSEELTEQLKREVSSSTSLRRELDELNLLNSSLMEDAESYQILLEQGMMMGPGLSSNGDGDIPDTEGDSYLDSFFAESSSASDGRRGSLADELFEKSSSDGKNKEKHIEDLIKENSDLKQQLQALAEAYTIVFKKKEKEDYDKAFVMDEDKKKDARPILSRMVKLVKLGRRTAGDQPAKNAGALVTPDASGAASPESTSPKRSEDSWAEKGGVNKIETDEPTLPDNQDPLPRASTDVNTLQSTPAATIVKPGGILSSISKRLSAVIPPSMVKPLVTSPVVAETPSVAPAAEPEPTQ